ncbi:MAG: YkgJ family cysteine cluster protein [Thermodesulfobacteriota bacterium]|nr:YkgJ family cysteine cluster protein [Thermodesulfobacteriota bacterium]
MMDEPKKYSLSSNKEFCNFCPGYCCYRLKGASLYIMAEDINRIARHLQITDGEVRKRYLENRYTFKTREDGSCIFLANGRTCKRCSIHEARPKQCRDFPYDKPCPYLESGELLSTIQHKIENSLLNS